MAVLFFYGTLMDHDLLRLVTGQRVDVQSAWLENHRRVPVVGRDYPMLVFQAGSRVEGLLARNVSAVALVRLCRYEGREYRLERRDVVTQSGDCVSAQVFMTVANVRGDLSKNWDFNAWRIKAKRGTISRKLAG